MDLSTTVTHNPHKSSGEKTDAELQRRGENVAFAVESTLTCLATDPYTDLWISQWVQNWYAKRNGNAPHGHLHQNIAGEYIGDILSGFALVGCTELFPRQMRAMGHAVGEFLDPFYRRTARKTTDIDPDDPKQREAYKQWRTYQEDNLMRTTVLSTAAIGLNIAVQKNPWLYNESPTPVILTGKLLGAGVTSALMLGSRLAFPQATEKADAWLSRHVFAPVLRKVDDYLGHGKTSRSWVERLEVETNGKIDADHRGRISRPENRNAEIA